MFALIGYLLCRNLKLELSATRRPREAPAWLMAALRGVAGCEEFLAADGKRAALYFVERQARVLDDGDAYFRND
jgi:hypothetical protein